MTLDLGPAVQEAVRQVVREEIRSALQENHAAADKFLSYAEAAEFVGCSISTIVKWIQDGALPTYGRGRTIRVLRSEVVAAMSQTTCVPKETPDDVVARLLAKRGK